MIIFSIAAATHAAITGTLVDESGKPVAGATIRAYAAEDWHARTAEILAGNAERPALGAAQSADDGTFKLDGKAPLNDLVIEAAGLQARLDEASDGDDLHVIVLHPKPGRKVRLISAGKPLANTLFVNGPLTFRSDAQGLVELSDTTGRMIVVGSDFAPTNAMVLADQDTTDMPVNRGVAIRGRVITAGGQPVANATISVSGWPLAKSASDGTFTIAHAPAGWRTMTATDGTRSGLVTSTRATSYDIRVKPAATISGTALPGSRVTITHGSEIDSADSVVADAQGKFSSAPLAPGQYAVRAFKRGYAMSSADVVVSEGAHLSRTLTQKPLPTLRGRVVDEQKQPVAGAFVSATPLTFRGEVVMTGSNGEFAIRRAATAATTPVIAVKAGYATGSSGPLNPSKNDATIVLPRGFPLQVRVIDRARKPVAGAVLSVSSGGSDDFMSRYEAACEQPLASKCRTTSDSGAIDLRATEGPYVVRVSGPSVVGRSLPAQTITAQTSPLAVQVDRGVDVSGIVAYADGTPMVDGYVSTRSFGFSTARIDPDGSFVFHNMPPGKVALVAMSLTNHLESPPVEVDAPARGVRITLPTPSRIEGRITDKDTGQPVTDFQIAAVPRDTRTMVAAQSMHSDDGSYALDPIQPGAYQLQFAAAGYARGTLSDVTVEEGKTAHGVDIQLDKGGSISGHVTANGQPASGVIVNYGSTTGPMMMTRGMTSTMTDENGDFIIDGIGTGDRTLQFQKDGFVTKRKNVDVARGKESRVEVELDSGRELQGKVVDKNGQAIAGARVMAMPVGGGMGIRPVTTDASGAFTVSALADGRYNVTASKEGFVTAQTPDIMVPATAPLTLTMDTGGTLTGRITGLTDAELAATDVTANGRGFFAHTPPNPDGSFTIRGIADGHVNVSAYVRNGMHPRQSVSQTVEVVNGAGPAVQIDFSEGLTVTGHVTRNGAPVTTGNVSFSSANTNRNGMIAGDGTYQIDGLVAGDYTVSVFGSSGIVYRSKYALQATTTYDIQMQGVTLRGRVLDASSNAPLGESTVVILPTRENPISRQATTDTEGNFAIDAVGDGSFEVRATHDQYAPGSQSVTISGGSAPNVDIKLDATQPTVFHVVDAQNNTPLDAGISVTDGKKMITQSHGGHDDDGGIRVYVGAGHYRAFVGARGYASQTVEFNAPNPDVRVALALAGRVMLTASKPTHVTIRSAMPPVPGVGGSVVRGAMATPNGVTVDGLAPGTYNIDVMGSSANVVLKSMPVTVYAGQTTNISVD